MNLLESIRILWEFLTIYIIRLKSAVTLITILTLEVKVSVCFIRSRLSSLSHSIEINEVLLPTVKAEI